MTVKENQWARIVSNAPETLHRLLSVRPEVTNFYDVYSSLKSLYRVHSDAAQTLSATAHNLSLVELECHQSFGDQLVRYHDRTAGEHKVVVQSVKRVLWSLMDDLLDVYDELCREGERVMRQRSRHSAPISIVGGEECLSLPAHEIIYDGAVRALEIRDTVKDVLRRLDILERRLI